MDQIIKAVMQQTGLSDVIAKQAVAAVIGQLKTQLPKPIADQLEAFIGGNSCGAAGGNADVMGSVIKGLGGMFGGKQ